MATPLTPIQGSDNQVFEYTDSLSYLIPEDQRHLHRGDVVVISKEGGVAGFLLTEIRPEADPEYNLWNLPSKPTYGGNGVGHATVRVKGGAFRTDVTVDADAKAGDHVYAVAATGTGKATVTLDPTAADVVLGTLYQAPTKTSGVENLIVILDPKAV